MSDPADAPANADSPDVVVRSDTARDSSREASVWRNRSYVRLWMGETFSQVGEQLGTLAIPVLAVLVLDATAQEVGLLNAAETLAFLLIGLPVGAWVDRMRKRRVMMTADAVRAVVLASIPLLWAFGVLQIWYLFVVGAVVGGATVFFDVTYQSYVPRLVRPEQVASANSGLEASAQVARVGGPAASGGLLAIMPAPLVVLATSIGYLFSFAFVASIRDDEPRHERSQHASLPREIGEGLRFVFGTPLLRRITLMTGSFNLFGGLVLTLLPLLVLRELGLSPAVYGVVTAMGAVGGILGALCTPWLSRVIGEGTVIVVAALVSSVPPFVIPLAALFPSAAIPLLVGADFLFSFGVLVYNIAQVSFRQRICPRPLLGRMNASIRFVVWGVMPISGVLAGALGGWLGVTTTMWIGAVLSLLGCGIVLFSPLTGMRKLPDGPAEPVRPSAIAD
ncbi:MFS transporter [Planctomonas sp. JC2975]|uniref:MFS transporter n=1 Tax=Planctomonas sp. JC2975 TaxID=2729626 RepID=UPI0014751F66|nr:MFS transporter [Planctomonas sp. JC2975]NNC11376.1 MFS transporter [Planctomonas sp. JC2975]